jgi:hypothetical protein
MTRGMADLEQLKARNPIVDVAQATVPNCSPAARASRRPAWSA